MATPFVSATSYFIVAAIMAVVTTAIVVPLFIRKVCQGVVESKKLLHDVFIIVSLCIAASIMWVGVIPVAIVLGLIVFVSLKVEKKRDEYWRKYG